MARLTNEHLHSDIKLVKQEVEYIGQPGKNASRLNND